MQGVVGKMVGEDSAQLPAVEQTERKEAVTGESKIEGKDVEAFQNRVQSALGAEMLSGFGTISYGDETGSPAMKFQVKGKAFTLRQAIGSVTNLLFGSKPLAQLNLSNPQAKDRLLEALRNALDE